MADFKKKAGEIWRSTAAKRTRKVLAAIGKCLLTIMLIGVITGSLVTCIMILFVMNKFDGNKGIPDLAEINNETSIVYIKDTKGEFVEHQ